VRRLRLGIVGAGRLGGFHAQKAAADDRLELVGVADPVRAQRDRVASHCSARPVADYRELFEQVDAVVVAAPTRHHHEIGVEFLRRGIHVLMEKPLATSAAEAEALVAAARESRVVLQVGHVERFNPAVAAAWPHLREPKFIEAVRASGFTFRSTDIGVVLDLMIHDLDLVLAMVRSPVRQVEALGLSVLGGHEDVAHARIEFECGCVASLSASRVSHEPARRMSVWAPEAYAAIDFAAPSATVVRPSETLLQRRFDIDALSAKEVEYYQQHLLEEHLPREVCRTEPVDALALELSDFAESILRPRLPRVSGEQGRDAVGLAEQVLARIHTHAWRAEAGGPVGPLAVPRSSTIPGPHWHLAPSARQTPRKEAG